MPRVEDPFKEKKPTTEEPSIREQLDMVEKRLELAEHTRALWIGHVMRLDEVSRGDSLLDEETTTVLSEARNKWMSHIDYLDEKEKELHELQADLSSLLN